MSHDDGREPEGWRESLALYSNLIQVGSAVVAVVSFILWITGMLPGLFLTILISFCFGVFFVLMLAKLFSSSNAPVDSIGAHLRTPYLEPHRDDVQSLLKPQPIQQPAKVRTLREARPPSAAPSQSGAGDTAEPNLVCSIINHLPAHEEYGILVEGHAEGDSDAFVYGVKIGNEFDPARKVGNLSDVSAQVFYISPDGQTLKVLRGTWLSESRYQIDFNVNNEHSLIIVGMPRSITQGAQLAFYLRREVSDSDKRIEDRIGVLSGDSYQVKIRLITESEGIVHKELLYGLTITREPIFKIELTEGKQQPEPKSALGDVPITQVPTAGNRETVVRRLRGFQTEGRRLLENSINNTLFSVPDFHHWEEEVETFIRESIGGAEANEFITNDPIIPYRDPYSLLNVVQTNLINTRLNRLSDLISQIQRS